MADFMEILHQTLSVVPVAYAEFTMGNGYGWLAPTLKKLQDPSSEVPLTIVETSWIASLHDLGRIFGPIFSALLVDVIGRKFMIIIGAFMFLLSWAMIFFTRTVFIICWARFVLGLGFGICDGVSSIYIGENCSYKSRGIFCSATIVCFYIGVLIQYVVATYFCYSTVALINLLSAFVGVLSTFLVVETPQFLLLKDQGMAAMNNLLWLRGTMVSDAEFQSIQQNVSEQKRKNLSFLQLLSVTANYRTIIIMTILSALVMGTGEGVVLAYASMILPPSNVFTSYEYTIMFGILELVAVIISVFVIERFNRRTLVLLSFAVIAISHSCTAALYFTQMEVTSVMYFPWLIFITINCFSSITAILDPVIHMLRGELFPQSIKGVGSCLSIMAHSGSGFIVSNLFLLISHAYGIYINFVIFFIIGLIGFVFTYCLLPESRGKTLVDIEKSYKKYNSC